MAALGDCAAVPPALPSGGRFANVKVHCLNRTTQPLLQYLPKLRDAGEIHYFYPSHSQYFAEAAVGSGKGLSPSRGGST